MLTHEIGHVVDRTILGNRQGHGIGYFITSLVAQVVLGILASTIVYWFSRKREFRADAAGAKSGNLARPRPAAVCVLLCRIGRTALCCLTFATPARNKGKTVATGRSPKDS